MNSQKNKSNAPHISIGRQPKAMLVSSPQQPETPMASAQQPIHDIPYPAPVAASKPSHDDIARRAHEIYVEKGCPQGQSEQIWRQAELEQQKPAHTAKSSKH